jgi:hypothetical protein
MRHADALSRSVNAVEKDLVLSKEVIREEQEKDELCMKYREYFWTDKDVVLYRQSLKEQPRVDTSSTGSVLTCYHKLPFTAHQDVSRTRIYKQEIS